MKTEYSPFCHRQPAKAKIIIVHYERLVTRETESTYTMYVVNIYIENAAASSPL